jgi:hypothetical protein
MQRWTCVNCSEYHIKSSKLFGSLNKGMILPINFVCILADNRQAPLLDMERTLSGQKKTVRVYLTEIT